MSFILKNVDKSFISQGKELEVVKNINISVQDGEFLSLVGPSGCGKTTILRMLAGLDYPSEGEISENGEPVTGPSPNRGFVFQQYSLFPWRTVLDNIAFGPEVRGVDTEDRYQNARNYIEMVGLSGFENSHPHELSGGMKQRVAIARALANDPLSLLMDEPFAALDVMTRHKLQEELVRIWQEEHKTIIFVTHNVDEAVFLADRVVVLSKSPGEIIESFQIELERIRDRTSPEFIDLKKNITSLLEK
ncbi:MAG: ABC transporter ATP-binding protein [Methanobacterium sp.]|nr:ABC transporter ATP-binding protein [Methanobacterium sp.]